VPLQYLVRAEQFKYIVVTVLKMMMFYKHSTLSIHQKWLMMHQISHAFLNQIQLMHF